MRTKTTTKSSRKPEAGIRNDANVKSKAPRSPSKPLRGESGIRTDRNAGLENPEQATSTPIQSSQRRVRTRPHRKSELPTTAASDQPIWSGAQALRNATSGIRNSETPATRQRRRRSNPMALYRTLRYALRQHKRVLNEQ